MPSEQAGGKVVSAWWFEDGNHAPEITLEVEHENGRRTLVVVPINRMTPTGFLAPNKRVAAISSEPDVPKEKHTLEFSCEGPDARHDRWDGGCSCGKLFPYRRTTIKEIKAWHRKHKSDAVSRG